MSRDIFEPHSKPQAEPLDSGGEINPRAIFDYREPKGPESINSPESPGNHGRTYPHGIQRRFE